MAAPKKIDTKQLILDSTERLIKQRQVEAISLQDIATEAGISKGTLYYYYTSKQLVLFDLVLMYLHNLANDFIVWIENKEKDTSLRRLIYYVLERGAHSERTKMHIYLINHSLQDSNTEVRNKFRDKYIEWKIMLKKTIIERCPEEDADLIAELLLIIIDGILISEMLGDKTIDCMSIAELLSRKIN